jgi:hypothetical protein
VVKKIAVAPWKAAVREAGSLRSPWTTEIPFLTHDCALGDEGSREMPRALQPGFVE